MAALIFDPHVDVTGIATAVLALTTTWLGWSTRRAARATKEDSRATAKQASATAEQVSLSREELEMTRQQLQASQEQLRLGQQQLEGTWRPVVVTMNRRGAELTRAGELLPGVPQQHDDEYLIPVRNIGAGPALNIEVSTFVGSKILTSVARTAMAVGDQEFMAIPKVAASDLHRANLTVRYQSIGGERCETSVRLDTMRPMFYDITVNYR